TLARIVPSTPDSGPPCVCCLVLACPRFYCPTVKSILLITVPISSRISTCHAPFASAGIVLRLHVRHGDPPIVSGTLPTSSPPWNQTLCSVCPLPPVTRIHSTTVPTLSGKAEPVSCGVRSTTDRARTASTLTLLAAAGGGAAGFAVESCAA